MIFHHQSSFKEKIKSFPYYSIVHIHTPAIFHFHYQVYPKCFVGRKWCIYIMIKGSLMKTFIFPNFILHQLWCSWVTIPVFVLLQEVLFYEDGEPVIDGESGDLRVRNLAFLSAYLATILYVMCAVCWRYIWYFEQFQIRTAPHDIFRREGNDLHTTVTITLVNIAILCMLINYFSCNSCLGYIGQVQGSY